MMPRTRLGPLLATAVVVAIVSIPSVAVGSARDGAPDPGTGPAVRGTAPFHAGATVLGPKPSLPPGGPSPFDRWANLTPLGQPPARDQASMTFDAAANATVLFGGYNASNGRAQNDT